MSKAEKAAMTAAEKNRARVLAWQKAFPEKVNAKNRAWHAANQERSMANKMRWRRDNPDKNRKCRRESERRRRINRPETMILSRLRARLRSVFRGDATPRAEDVPAVNFLRWCAPKGSLGEWHIDHLFPLASEQGQMLKNAPENVRWLPACENLRKQDNLPTQEEVDEHALLVAAWTASR